MKNELKFCPWCQNDKGQTDLDFSIIDDSSGAYVRKIYFCPFCGRVLERKQITQDRICENCRNRICKDMYPTMQEVYIRQCLNSNRSMYIANEEHKEGADNKENGTSEVVELLKSYAVYEQYLFSEKYAKTFFDPYGKFKAMNKEECLKKMDFIERLIEGLAPSNIATILNLHYINKLPIEKCAECMVISRTSAYRVLKRAHIAVNNRYQRMKGTNNEQSKAD